MSHFLPLLICWHVLQHPASFSRSPCLPHFDNLAAFPTSISCLPAFFPVIEGLLRRPPFTTPAEPRRAGGGFCAVFATINYTSYPASSPKTPPSNFDDCFAPFPGSDETFFQDGVEGFLDLGHLGVGTQVTQIQLDFEDTKSLLLLDQHNPECLHIEGSSALNTPPASCGPWTFDRTNSSNLPTSWDHNPVVLDKNRDYYASDNPNRSVLASASIEDSAPDISCSQWPLSFSTETFLSRPDDLSGPWSQLGTLDIITSHYPNETPSEPETPSNSLAMPGQGTFIAASTSTEQSRSDSAGNSPQSITSSPAESTTSQSSAIDCMWPQCNKSFPTRAAYNHHARYHTMSFQCPSCPKRQATKREHDRHINSVHVSREKYYCPFVGCSRSEVGGGGHFSREDGCSRHMLNKHSVKGGEMECRMDEQTRRIRRERKMRKRKGVE